MAPSSSGLGRRPLTAETGVRLPLGLPLEQAEQMKAEQIIRNIEQGRIVAILRGNFRGREVEIATVLLEEGIRALEVTLNSPGALESIQLLANNIGTRMAVGAGTVLKPEEVEAAEAAGARFIVSPNRNLSVIGRTKACGLVSLPGCFTPSEVVEALESGADAIKLFPARTLGPDFVRALLAPLPGVRLIATGGVTPENAGGYFSAGAWAIATGADLVGPDTVKPGGLDKLRARARAYVTAVSSFKTATHA